MIQAEFLQLITQISGHAKISVSSWIRSEKRNKGVGGQKYSLHLVGLAVDVVADNKIEKAKCRYWCKRLRLKCLDEGDHLHIQIP